MKKIIAIILIGVCVFFSAPAIAMFIRQKDADEEVKKPLKEEVVLLDSAKTSGELGIHEVKLKTDGSGASLYLESGSVKFVAGCGADKFIINVNEAGSTVLTYEKQTIYSSDTRYELYKFKKQSITPGIAFGSTQEVTVELYAEIGGRLYLLQSQKATIDGINWDFE